MRGELERHWTREHRVCRLRDGHGAHRRRLRARGGSGRHIQPAVHRGFHPQRDQAAGSVVEIDHARVLRDGARLQYWNGCSTGGRQGYLLAQELGKELQGILANAPAIYWTRFQTGQMWGQIVMKDLLGTPITADKLNQVTASAVAACDAADGVTDGVIDDPRTCHF